MFLEFNDTGNIGSEISTFTFASDGAEISIKDSPAPFRHQIKNKPEDLASRNITLKIPGFIRNERLKLDSPACTLVLSLKALNDAKGSTNLTVLVQYQRAPSLLDHDLKIVVRNGNETELQISDQAPVATNQTAGITLQRTVYARKANDSSIVLWNFPEYTYAESARSNKSELFLSFVYEGPIPDLVIKEDLYRFDELEYAGSFNYSLTTFCASCRYADLQTNTWNEDGCQVSLNIIFLLTLQGLGFSLFLDFGVY